MMSAEQKAQWLADRCGKLTASRMADAMSMLKNGQPTLARTKLMHELLAERITGQSVPHVVTDAMLWGLEHEDEAIDVFVGRTGRDVRLSRFYEHPTILNFGATPDRELDDGLLEVKCPTTPKFLGWVLNGIVPNEHRAQMTAQLLCSGKSWCGFIAYDPRIRDENKQLFMRKFEPTDEERTEVEAAAIAFLDELDVMFDAFVCAA
jgi:predicted phage-related endonuclease